MLTLKLLVVHQISGGGACLHCYVIGIGTEAGTLLQVINYYV